MSEKLEPNPLDLSSGTSPLVPGGEKGSEVRKDETEAPESMEPSYKSWTKEQVIPCLLIYAGMLGQVMCLMMIGPSLLDLQLVTHTNIQQVSWFLSARAMGALVGSVILSFTMEMPYYWFALTAAHFITGFAFAIIPWISNFPIVIILFVIMGLGMGYFMTGGMLSIYSIWTDKKDSVSWLNGGQLLFLVGGIMGPLLVKPFFAFQNIPKDENGTVIIVPPNATDLLANATEEQLRDTEELVPGLPVDELPVGFQTYVMYAFLIGGLFVTVTCILFLVAYKMLGGIHFTVRNPMAGGASTQKRLLPMKFGLIVVLFAFHVITSVIVRTYSSYIVTFTVNYLGWTKSKGSVLTSIVFIGAFLGKFVCIFLVRVVRIEPQLFIGLAINIFGTLILMFFINMHGSVIWICSLIIAVGDANITATILAWTDKYMGIKGIVGALYNIGGTVGEIIAAPLIGWLFHEVSYEAFLYMLVIATLSNFVFMCLLQLMGMRYRVLVAQYGAEENESSPILNGSLSSGHHSPDDLPGTSSKEVANYKAAEQERDRI